MPYIDPPKVGTCYCGCGERTDGHFSQGQSAAVTAWLDALEGKPPLAVRLVQAGYGPDGRNLYQAALEAGLVDSGRARHDKRR
jgi:hypothetical protein